MVHLDKIADDDLEPRYGHGEIIVKPGWRALGNTIKVYGGPYDKVPQGTEWYRVCLREQIPKGKQADFHLPINDFSVPQDDRQVELVLIQMATRSMRGQPVYVGCMGGMGRTGIILALLARLSREYNKKNSPRDAVDIVREAYHPKAVETKEQYHYVMDFDLSRVRGAILHAALSQMFERLCVRVANISLRSSR